ncbi:MSP domain-containing protein [Caenorhabditis elegans]|uniref:MSP domain-containing protein n=1 Tax=Caenorhabditis elegans TaxID=6239 RepID=G4S429_CAEEL|nr:MSP domain-containing protein [Caenorhabditis elegans]CCD66056.1 MSP domain-containing protein [Caenorhabditis elegans]|eukprot:NP_001254115.1 Major sperm protein [Caenorhabditis elegans]
MTTLSQGDQQMIIFEDDTRDQTMFLEVANRFQKRMKFGWETSFGPLLKVNPPVGIMEPGETKSFEIQFNGGHLPNTDVMDADHSVKMWLTPAETRKRSLEVKEHNSPSSDHFCCSCATEVCYGI